MIEINFLHIKDLIALARAIGVEKSKIAYSKSYMRKGKKTRNFALYSKGRVIIKREIRKRIKGGK